MQEIIIAGGEAGQRLDKFLKKYLREASSGFIYKMLRKKNITLNGRKATGSEMLAQGDLLKLFLSSETILRFRGAPAVKHASAVLPEDHILFADGAIAAINKPAGWLTQPSGEDLPALSDILPDLLLNCGVIGEDDLRAFRPAPANRLDRNTTGIVLAGVSLHGSQRLSEQIRDRIIEKEYLVLVRGDAKLQGVKKAHYRKDPHKNLVTIRECLPEDPPASEIITSFETVAGNQRATLLLVKLITGRPHQIRAHLNYLGYPVIGDRKYGNYDPYGAGRQMLHAYRVTLPPDPGTSRKDLTGPVSGFREHISVKADGRLQITAPIPEDMRRVMTTCEIDPDAAERIPRQVRRAGLE